MSDGKAENSYVPITCSCGFLVCYGPAEIAGNVSCIYCVSEREFFRLRFTGKSETGDLWIHSTIADDKSPWRRGLMHTRKQSMQWAYEDIMFNKDEKNE